MKAKAPPSKTLIFQWSISTFAVQVADQQVTMSSVSKGLPVAVDVKMTFDEFDATVATIKAEMERQEDASE